MDSYEVVRLMLITEPQGDMVSVEKAEEETHSSAIYEM